MKDQEGFKTNDQETSTKRKNTTTTNNNNDAEDFEDVQIAKRRQDTKEDDNHFLTLSLSFGPPRSKRTSLDSPLSLSPLSPSMLPPQQETSQSLQIETLTPQTTTQKPFQLPTPLCPYTSTTMPEPSSYVTPPMHRPEVASASGPSRAPRARRNPTQAPREGKSETIPVPFPWATNRRATVHSLNYLLSKQLEIITGAVQCKRCEKQYELGFNLREKFLEVGSFIAENKSSMHDRAPSVWMNPVLPTCRLCHQENSVKPLISEKKKSINWLFLLLGQMLGCCTLEQLKYFCKHTKNHRTGAKDRVLYLTYLGLCKQLDPNGPFDR